MQCAAGLAASVGIGRFVFTPILPMMVAQAGLGSQDAALLATANYIGYLIGAVTGILLPAALRSRAVVRASLLVLVLTMAAMPLSESLGVWFVLRLAAGIVSALVFMAAVSVALASFQGRDSHVAGWAFGGIGVGIALSGALVLVLRTTSTWSMAWWSAAAMAAVFAAVAWPLPFTPVPREVRGARQSRRPTRRFVALLTSYSLEGVGYIIAGTFLVVAIGQTAPVWISSASWIIVGLAAIPSSALLSWFGHRWSRPGLLVVALTLQAIGVALPGLFDGTIPAMLSAVLFGATFVGIGTLSLSIGTQLAFPRSVALLTTGYAVGQIAGPLLVAPLLSEGFRVPLLVGAAVIGVAAIAAGAVRAGPRPSPR